MVGNLVSSTRFLPATFCLEGLLPRTVIGRIVALFECVEFGAGNNTIRDTVGGVVFLLGVPSLLRITLIKL